MRFSLASVALGSTGHTLRNVSVGAQLHEGAWKLSVEGGLSLALPSATSGPPIDVAVSGSWVLGGHIVLNASQLTVWEAPFNMSWLTVDKMQAVVERSAVDGTSSGGGAWSVLLSGRATVSCNGTGSGERKELKVLSPTQLSFPLCSWRTSESNSSSDAADHRSLIGKKTNLVLPLIGR